MDQGALWKVAPDEIGSPPQATHDQSRAIQLLLDGASPGGIVTIQPGTYAETLRITKPLELECLPGAVFNGAGLTGSGITVDGAAGWSPSEGA